MSKSIVVLDRRFVYIGDVSFKEVDGIKWGYISNSKNIRVWGTEGKGLAYIALKGPTSETVLDDSGDIKFPISALIHIIKCENDHVW